MISTMQTSASSLQSLFWGKNLSYAPYTFSRTLDFIPAMTSPPLGMSDIKYITSIYLLCRQYEYAFLFNCTGPQRLSVQCGVGFRPCIDIHKVYLCFFFMSSSVWAIYTFQSFVNTYAMLGALSSNLRLCIWEVWQTVHCIYGWGYDIIWV